VTSLARRVATRGVFRAGLGPYGRAPGAFAAAVAGAATGVLAVAVDDGGALTIAGDLAADFDGSIVLHAGDCADPGPPYAPGSGGGDPWAGGGFAGAFAAVGGAAAVGVVAAAAFDETWDLGDVAGRAVGVHDSDDAHVACGEVAYAPPADAPWADACLRDAAGVRYTLSLDDPAGVRVRASVENNH